MAKRFTDTGLHKQPWFRRLSPKMKCAVRFLFDECDNAGVWVIDMETLSYFVGEDVTLPELLRAANSDKENRIEVFKSDKIFIPGFTEFQYGTLRTTCKPHRPIIEKLKKYGLYERVSKGFQKGIENLEEKEKEQEKEEEKEYKGGMGGISIDLKIKLPDNVLEAAEMNQYTLTKKKNTDFIRNQWLIFLHERINEPDKIFYRLSDLTGYFLNWIRNKHPKNGTYQQSSKRASAADNAAAFIASAKAEFDSYTRGEADTGG